MGVGPQLGCDCPAPPDPATTDHRRPDVRHHQRPQCPRPHGGSGVIGWSPIALAGLLALAESLPGVGVFLPGEIMITALATSVPAVHTPLLGLAVAVGACVGDQFNYWIGRLLGPRLSHSMAFRKLGRTRWDRAVELDRPARGTGGARQSPHSRGARHRPRRGRRRQPFAGSLHGRVGRRVRSVGDRVGGSRRRRGKPVGLVTGAGHRWGGSARACASVAAQEAPAELGSTAAAEYSVESMSVLCGCVRAATGTSPRRPRPE